PPERISAGSNSKGMSSTPPVGTNSRGDGPRPTPGPPRPGRPSGPIPMAAPPLPPCDSLETPACAEPDCDAQPERTSATTPNSATIACHPRPLMAPPLACAGVIADRPGNKKEEANCRVDAEPRHRVVSFENRTFTFSTRLELRSA